MIDFGIDISALSDLHFAQKSAHANLGEALARRLMTPRGGLFYDPSYGFDVRQYLNAVNNQANQFELETLSAAQCQLDERVRNASVTVLTLDERSAQLQVQVTTTAGPFSLILAVTNVSVEVLRGNT